MAADDESSLESILSKQKSGFIWAHTVYFCGLLAKNNIGHILDVIILVLMLRVSGIDVQLSWAGTNPLNIEIRRGNLLPSHKQS